MRNINAEIARYEEQLEWHRDSQVDLASEIAAKLTTLVARYTQLADKMKVGDTVSFELSHLASDVRSWTDSAKHYDEKIIADLFAVKALKRLIAE